MYSSRDWLVGLVPMRAPVSDNSSQNAEKGPDEEDLFHKVHGIPHCGTRTGYSLLALAEATSADVFANRSRKRR